MSVASSILFIYNFFHYDIDQSQSGLLFPFGVTGVVLLSIANIVYFISAYFSYGYFQLKFFEKLGAKEILHSNIIFK
jgi:hypothetical protein